MSRIGNKMIVPPGVKIKIKARGVEVQGPKGKLNIRSRPALSSSRRTGFWSRSAKLTITRTARLVARASCERSHRRHAPSSRKISISSASAIARK